MRPPTLEKAKSYLDLQLSPGKSSGSQITPKDDGPFVTISRESGSGGSSLARMLAARLNLLTPTEGTEQPWTVFDQQIVQRMLAEHKLAPSLARFLPEDKLSELKASIGEILGLHPSLWELVRDASRLLCDHARKGRVILVGRGANFATQGVDGGFHIRLVAPPDHRARQMANLLGRSLDEAAAYNKRVDAARNNFVRSIFDRDVTDPNVYHLVINMARFSLDQAVDVITPAVVSRMRARR